jgi:hypothetical protein
MAKGDEKRAQRMIDAQSEKLDQRNDILFQYNYGQYQNPLQGPQPRSGIGTGMGPGANVGQHTQQPGQPPNRQPPAGGQQQQQQGKMTDAQAEQFFNQLFPGEKVSPEDLEAHRAELEAAGFVLNPNAGGRITDLTLPSGNTVDPIQGAGSGLNKKMWLVHPAGGSSEGNFTGRYGDYGQGILSPALGGYRTFAESGGFSPQDITNIRARSIAPIRAMYQQGMDETERAKNLQGGYMPNFAPAMAKMQREQSYRIGDQALNTEAELANQIRQGRLAGLGGLHQLGLGINQQGLQAGELGANTANQMIRNQIAKSGVKTNFQEALGNVGGVADIVGRGADVITGF